MVAHCDPAPGYFSDLFSLLVSLYFRHTGFGFWNIPNIFLPWNIYSLPRTFLFWTLERFTLWYEWMKPFIRFLLTWKIKIKSIKSSGRLRFLCQKAEVLYWESRSSLSPQRPKGHSWVLCWPNSLCGFFITS